MNILNYIKDVDSTEFNNYLQVRGEGVYLSTFQALSIMTGCEKIQYADFVGLMKYDKRLRDKLYVFLGTVEEYLKNEIWSNLQYTGVRPIKKLDIYTKKNINKGYQFDHNFFKNSEFDFITIYRLLIEYDLRSDTVDLDNIRKLRNKVMHHSFILIDTAKTINKKNIQTNLNQIQQCINSLYKTLPSKWNESFKKVVIDCNRDNNSDLLSKYIKVEVNI